VKKVKPSQQENKMNIKTICVATMVTAVTATQAVALTYEVRVSSPLMVSAAAGFKTGQADGSLRPTFMAEAGIGGGKLSVGMDNIGEGAFGYGVKAAFLRTWIEPLDVDADVSYLGVDGEFSVKRLIFSLGGYRRISSGDDDWIVNAGLGFRF
jgi:hypothetical protein